MLMSESAVDAMVLITSQKIVRAYKMIGDGSETNAIPCAVTVAIPWTICLEIVKKTGDMSVPVYSPAWHYL